MVKSFLRVGYGHWSLVITTVVMAASLALSIATLYNFTSATGGIRTNERIPYRAQAVELRLTQAETGQRGYIITDNFDYLDIYQRGIDSFQPAYAQLMTEAAHNPHLDAPIKDMGRVATAKMLELADVIRDRREGNLANAVAKVNTHIGKNLMDEFRKDISTVNTIAAQDVAAYEEIAAHAAELAVVSLAVNVGSIIVLILMLSDRAKIEAGIAAGPVTTHHHDPNEQSLNLDFDDLPPPRDDGHPPAG